MCRTKVIASAIATLFSTSVLAQDRSEERSPEEVTVGEARITMNSEFAKVLVDGEEWEEHEFIDNGRTLIIHGLNRTVPHVVSLRPVVPNLKEIEVRIEPSDWKLVKVKKQTLMWRVEKKVNFEKAQ